MDKKPQKAFNSESSDKTKPKHEKIKANKYASFGGKKNTLSVIAIIFGVLGIVLSLAKPVALFCCFIGIIFGIASIVKKQKKGPAIAGIACGAVGIILVVVFYFLGFGLTSIIDAILGDEYLYNENPEKFCATRPSHELCNTNSKKKVTKKQETCEENLDGAGCAKDSEEYWNAFCKKYPTNIQCTVDEVDTSWVEDYIDKLLESNGGNPDETDIPDGLVDTFKDYVSCLNDAGLKISSYEDFAKLDELKSDEITQETIDDSLKCNEAFEKNIEKFNN